MHGRTILLGIAALSAACAHADKPKTAGDAAAPPAGAS